MWTYEALQAIEGLEKGRKGCWRRLYKLKEKNRKK